MSKQEVAFLKKSSAKDFFESGAVSREHMDGFCAKWRNTLRYSALRAVLSGQKFFAERSLREGLFYKKATACLGIAP
jgi:hypothetical protein